MERKNSPADLNGTRTAELLYNVLDDPTSSDARWNLRRDLKFGTKEWSTDTYNIACAGSRCPNGCKYCYVPLITERHNIPEREFAVDPKKVRHRFRKVGEACRKTFMFPTSHDVFPHTKNDYLESVTKMLDAGHAVLMVTKPRPEVVEFLSERISPERDFEFRFTVGSDDGDVLRRFEPGAPSLEDRWRCMRLLRDAERTFSVSVEPVLSDPVPLVAKLHEEFAASLSSVWIGLCNHRTQLRNTGRVTEEDKRYLDELYARENVLRWVRELRRCDFVRWKESVVKLVLGE